MQNKEREIIEKTKKLMELIKKKIDQQHYKNNIKSTMKRRTVLITACGGKKLNHPEKAGIIYKSTRIRYLYKKSKELNIPFYILSAKYGVVNSETIISPYDDVMTSQKCKELFDKIVEKLREVDVIIYYRGGARREYLECIEKVAKTLEKKLIVFGYANMGDIGRVEEVVYGAEGE